jgi:hypothetical protein
MSSNNGGGGMNKVWVGSQGAPPTECTTGPGANVRINVPQTPIIAEKPYLALEGDKYFLMVPHVEANK